MAKSTFVKATDFTTFTDTYAKDYKFRTCGLGAIDNKGTVSKKLLCVDMDISDAETCKEALNTDDEGRADEIVFPEDGTAVCLTSISDKNVCPGDYGGNF